MDGHVWSLDGQIGAQRPAGLPADARAGATSMMNATHAQPEWVFAEVKRATQARFMIVPTRGPPRGSAPATWRDLVDHAADLSSRDAAMVLAGVMDAVDAIDETERAAVIDLGLSSGSGIVRLAALPVLAGHQGIDAARKRPRLTHPRRSERGPPNPDR
ncbi:MAG: hypothetical protein MUF83_20475 [Acidimicrobiales bacterium]|nr:hypothetical protein [Acidimicrobiales bacterium]